MNNPALMDYIKVYEDSLDLEFCETLIEHFESDWGNQLSTGQDSPLDITKDGKELYKKFTEIDFARVPEWHKKYGSYLREKVIQYSKLYFDDIQWPSHLRVGKMGYEGFRIKRYLPNTNDRIDAHTDATNLAVCKRFLSLFWYLNDVEEGGETMFTELNYYVKPKAGMLLVFPPMWMFPHAGCPTVVGTKYILHSYLHYAKEDTHDFRILTDLKPLKSGAVKPDGINKQ